MNSKIQKQSPIPLYHQVKESLIERIENGEFIPGKLIPTEKELIEYYKVSRTTIRQAIGELIQRNYLYIQHGVGTFASQPKVKHNSQELLSFTEEMRQRGLWPESKLIRHTEILPTKKVAEKLLLSMDDPIIEIIRLRLADGEPIGIHYTYLPKKRIPDFQIQKIENTHSLYEVLENDYSVVITEANEVIEAASANDEEAQLLKIDCNSPVLLVERIAFSERGDPIELVEMVYPAYRYKYYNHLIRRRIDENSHE